MSRLPFRLNEDWESARGQVEELLRILYEERIGGLKVGSSLAKVNDNLAIAAGEANGHLMVNAAGTDVEYATPYKTGAITREMDADSGNVSYSGVGFRPSAIIFISCLDSSVSVGFSALAHYFVTSYGTTPAYGRNAANSIGLFEDGSKYQIALVASYDDDGFTLTWTKGSTPASATAYIYYMAFR